jgi:hypothetical protein
MVFGPLVAFGFWVSRNVIPAIFFGFVSLLVWAPFLMRV